MKKTFLLAITILAFSSISVTSCSTHKNAAKVKRPNPEQIQATLDRICTEGYNLFIAERVNWVASDSAVAHCGIDRLGGNIIWQPTDSTWRAVFFDKEHEKSIFELNYNINSNQYLFSYTTRAISETERIQWEMKSTMFDNALERYGDSLRYNSNYGRPNFDFIRIDNNTIRMYILQGVERSNTIPFGNDYSIDFDNNGNAKAFRRYHKSFIPISTVDENGAKISSAFHSHLKDNPYITPTDICNFLLYRGDIKQTFVLSTALDGIIIYDAENNRAVFLTHEAMDKIRNNQH